jgi:hypothetical protein
MSKSEQPEWVVLVHFSNDRKEFLVDEVRRITENVLTTRLHHMRVHASDEIGAYNEARRVLMRLGFTLKIT